MTSIAYALGAGGGAAGQGGGGITTFIPLILMFVIFYFLLIRPQQKKQKKHQEMISNLKKGDKVLTGGSIHGKITSEDENTITVEIASNVRVKVARGSISALLSPPSQQAQPQKGKNNS